jgi:hypothetical protein
VSEMSPWNSGVESEQDDLATLPEFGHALPIEPTQSSQSKFCHGPSWMHEVQVNPRLIP